MVRKTKARSDVITIRRTTLHRVLFVVAMAAVVVAAFLVIRGQVEGAYEGGVADGVRVVARAQVEEGDVFLLLNGSVRRMPLEEACRLAGGASAKENLYK